MLPRGKSAAVVRQDETTKSLLGKITGVPGVDSFASRPSPNQFEKFVPWVCAQWCASTAVIITKRAQEKYVKYDCRKQSRSIRKIKPINVHNPVAPSVISAEETTDYGSTKSVAQKGPMKQDEIVPIYAYYDDKRNLVEIAIIGSAITVSRKVIHAISLSIPYYSMLNRFTFRKGGLTHELIYEINKLIPISNITELCFDNSYVRQSNYYIFLEQFSQLKYLSLNQCGINDEACKKLFVNLDFNGPSANSLQIIELGSNAITDVGAKFIGSVLKMNRCLVHINLSGNKITDQGFKYILNYLMEFPLTAEECMAAKRRRLCFLHDKIAVYERCLNDVKYGQSDDMISTSSRRSLNVRKLRGKARKNISEQTLTDMAEIMTKRIIGEFTDPYSPENIVIKEDTVYAKGNLILCSLNMAYNDLTIVSVLNLAEVVTYQYDLEKLPIDTGLIRVTLDGNYIPATCMELDDIDECLKKVVTSRMPLLRKARTSSLLKKIAPSKHNTATFATP